MPPQHMKLLIHVLALMNTRWYKPGTKVANEVYTRSGIVVREFGEAEGADGEFYDKLAKLLDPAFPWAHGKAPKKTKAIPLSPLLARACSSKVSGAFIWPVFSAFRLLIEDDGSDGLRFKTDPIRLFEDKKTEMSSTIQTAFENQGRVVQQVGKATDAWIRLESQIQMGMMIRDRLRVTV